jgi:ribose/xylose/arabinose/galactoside ABC-type transport system permease subunit
MTAEKRLGKALGKVRMEAILVVLCLLLAYKAPHFLTSQNLLTILRSVSMQGVIAFGMTLVIIVGEIDLSVGATVSFAGCLMAWLTQRGLPIPLNAALTIALGYTQGAFVGWMRSRYLIPSFITTLALLTSLKGAALELTGGFPITAFPDWYAFLGSGYVAGIPFPAIVLLLTCLCFHILMKYTAFGRAVYAAGGNPEAARLSGISVAHVRTQALALTGGLAALSGLMLASRINSGTPDAAQGWELDIIAAVIIGGTSLSGGVGTIRGTLVGVLFTGIIANGMTLLDIPSYRQYIVRGLLIFAAVMLNRTRKAS